MVAKSLSSKVFTQWFTQFATLTSKTQFCLLEWRNPKISRWTRNPKKLPAELVIKHLLAEAAVKTCSHILCVALPTNNVRASLKSLMSYEKRRPSLFVRQKHSDMFPPLFCGTRSFSSTCHHCLCLSAVVYTSITELKSC